MKLSSEAIAALDTPSEKIERVWSEQQLGVFAKVEDPKGPNLLINAVAGSGKTTTLVESCRRMNGSVAFCAFNRKIAEEIKVRVADLRNVDAGTFHSFGFKALRSGMSARLTVEFKKLEILQNESHLRQPEKFQVFARRLVSIMKQSGYGAESVGKTESIHDLITHFELDQSLPGEDPETLESGIGYAKQLLQTSNAQAVHDGIIDFDDMIYLPLALDLKMPQYDWVLIDEAQDTNWCRRIMATRMLKPGGRMIAVGDPHQAIYGFTGADADSLDLIKDAFGCAEAPLTVTYRCGKKIVDLARTWVKHITAHESNSDGLVKTIQGFEFDKLPKEELRKTDAILCRNTRPLIEMAFALIRRGIGCHVEGRDIGQNLITLTKRWKVRDLQELTDRLEEYEEKERAKLLSKGKEMQAEQLADKVSTIMVIIGTLKLTDTPWQLQQAILALFGDTEPGKPSPNLTLSTIHKSKGREWDRVYLYGRDMYMPSKYAKQEWQLQQEYNLIYVAVTRARHELIEVSAS